jgi:hypothetical protein
MLTPITGNKSNERVEGQLLKEITFSLVNCNLFFTYRNVYFHLTQQLFLNIVMDLFYVKFFVRNKVLLQ